MPDQGNVKDRAVAAIEAAIAAHSAARDKIVQVIVLKDLNRQDTRREEAQRAALDVKIGNLEEELAEYRAAAVVIGAPTVDEIAAVRARIKEIRDLAVADAALQTGTQTITAVLKEAVDLKDQNRKA